MFVTYSVEGVPVRLTDERWNHVCRRHPELNEQEKGKRIDWDYDEEADVLYLSLGKPRKATGVDIGQGVVVRYDEKKKEVVGLTVLGVRAKLLESLKK